MQRVEGSNPFSRLPKSRPERDFVVLGFGCRSHERRPLRIHGVRHGADQRQLDGRGNLGRHGTLIEEGAAVYGPPRL
jgi:hypothetical protein